MILIKSIKKTYPNSLFIYLGLAVIVFLIGLFSPLNPINGTGFSGTDSSVYRYIGKAIIEGDSLYRDVFDHKGPITYFLNAMGYALNPIWGIWVINTLLSFVFSIYIYKLAKLYSDSFIVICSAIFATLLQYSRCYNGGNTVEGYCVVFIAIQLYYFLKFINDGDIGKHKVYLCGICAAIVCMLKINTIVVCVVYIPYIIYLLVADRQYKKLFSLITVFILGFITIVVPIVAYLAYVDGLNYFWEYYFVFNFKYIDTTITERMAALLYFLKNIFVLVPLLFVCYRAIRYRKAIDVSALAFIILNLLTMASPGRQYGYYAIILAPALVYPYVIIIEEVFNRIQGNAIRNILIGFIALGAVFTFVYRPITISVSTPIWTNEYTIASNAIKENTQPSDKISVLGNANLLYLLSERNSATKYDFVSEAIYPNAIVEIKQEKPKVIIVTQKFGEEDLLDFFVQEDYRQLCDLDISFSIWVRE